MRIFGREIPPSQPAAQEETDQLKDIYGKLGGDQRLQFKREVEAAFVEESRMKKERLSRERQAALSEALKNDVKGVTREVVGPKDADLTGEERYAIKVRIANSIYKQQFREPATDKDVREIAA